MTTNSRVGISLVVGLLLIATACSQGLIPVDATGTSIPGAVTGSTSQVLRHESTFEAALCSGFEYGLVEFGSAIADRAFHDLWDGYTYDDCMAEASESLSEISAAMGPDRAPGTVEGWFAAGCYQSAFAYALELSGDPQIADGTAVMTCGTPFQTAKDLNADWALLRSGICYYLDFEPSTEQIESGLVPCES